MSIAAFSLAEAPIARPSILVEKKSPPKRTLTALADATVVPEAR